jgi:hypothetical protein
MSKTGGNYRISEHLKEMLQADRIILSYSINGKVRNQHFKVEGGECKSIGKVLTAILAGKAMSGDISAIREILDRTEGKATQPIDMGFSTADIQPHFDRIADLLEKRDNNSEQEQQGADEQMDGVS